MLSIFAIYTVSLIIKMYVIFGIYFDFYMFYCCNVLVIIIFSDAAR